MNLLKSLVIVGLLFSCLIIGSESKKKASKINQMIRKSLPEDKLFQNVLKVLGWNLNNLGEDAPKKYCHTIGQYEPALIGFQNVKISDVLLLKKCFAQLSKSCAKPKRKLRAKKRLQRRHTRNFCDYEILGAGSSNNEETTFFTPIVFRQKRNIRTTGWNGTFWLSETPDVAFTKIDEASTFHIATWAYLKLAVAEKRERRAEQNAFERLLMVLKKSLSDKLRKKKRPSTKWIDLYVVNAQLDGDSPIAAKKQLNILIQTLKEKKIGVDKNAAILSIGVSGKITDDVSKILKTSGYKDALKGSALSESTMIWSIGFDNVLSTNVEINGDKSGAVLSALSYD